MNLTSQKHRIVLVLEISGICKQDLVSYLDLATPMNFLVPDSLPSELQQEAKDRQLVPGQILFHYQDAAKYVFALQEGRIRMVRYTCEGNLVVFQIVRAGESFAESALFTETYQCNAVVEKPSRITCYPKNLVWQTLQNKPDLALNLLPKLARRSQSLKNLLELRSIRSASDRILQYLFFIAAPEQSEISFDRSYKDIATELGLSAEAFYRSLADLERSGVISRRGREIKLLVSQT